MANSSKAKGDKAEREIVALLVAATPDLCVEKPERMLGAGRRDDIGDLRVYPDATMQVKAYKVVSEGLRAGAAGALDQQMRAGQPFAVGFTPIPRAPVGDWSKVRWLAAAYDWPVPTVGERPTTETFQAASLAKAIAWLRDPAGDVPIAERVVELVRTGMPTMWVGSVQSWVADYRLATDQPEPAQTADQSRAA
jgi:hypothetical protein